MRTLWAKRYAGWVLGAIVSWAMLAAGCSGGGAAAERAYRETTALDSKYAVFGTSLLDGAQDARSRALLLEALDSDLHTVALAALRAVSVDPPAEARPALQRVFTEKRGGLKLQAAVGLARLGDTAALDWLAQEATAGGGMVNPEAAVVLAQTGQATDLRERLAALMEHDDLSVRNEVYAILAAVNQPWSAELLRQGLDREHGEDRQQAIVALGRIGGPADAATIVRFTNTQGLVFASIEALGHLGDPSVADALEAMADHEQPLVRVYVGAALWKLGRAERGRQVLQPLLEDTDATVRRNVAEQLASVEDPATIDLLGPLCADSDRAVRLAALRAIREAPEMDAEEVLRGMLADPDYEIVSLALSGLARHGEAASLPEVEPLLEHANPYVVVAAAQAMMEIEDRAGAAPAG